MTARKLLIVSALGLGFVSTNTQVVLLRELLVAFAGNELILAIVLAVWLLSIAAGSFTSSLLRTREGPGLPALLFIIAGPLVPIQVLSVRFLEPLAGTFGEVLSPATVVGLSAVCILPGGLVLGGLFVALVRLGGKIKEVRTVPVIYGYEALGAAVAGAVLSLYFMSGADAYEILATAWLVSLACGTVLLRAAHRPRRSVTRAVLVVSVAALAAVAIANRQVDLATRGIEWRPLQVVKSVETRYGNIVVTSRDHLFDFFETGSLSYTVPDPRYAEESVHIPMLYHPQPKRVLVIGGAGSGIIREVAKYPSVEAVDYVELDPETIALTREYAPRGWLEGPPGVAVRAVYGDGRRYVARTSNRYDVVIASIGMPVTLQTARYYTVEFFGDVARLIGPVGVFAFKIPSGGAYVSPDLASLLSSLENTCRRVFNEVVLLPGDYIQVISSPSLPLEDLTDSLSATLQQRGIRTSFVDAYHLFDTLAPMRRSVLDSTVARYDQGTVNTDARPVSASYAIARWARYFTSGKILAVAVRKLTPVAFITGLTLSAIVITSLLAGLTRARRRAFPAALVIYSAGLTTMFTEVLMIFGFQIVNGYVYAWIAALVGAFMLGMGLAAGAAGSRGLVGRRTHLPLLMAGLAVVPMAAIAALRTAEGSGTAAALAADILFPGLAFAAGLLGGIAFALASTFLAAREVSEVRSGALAYGLDLFGATLAGFATAFLAIPSLGISVSAYAVAASNGILLAVVAAWSLRER
jgi:spermidine synthase